MEVESEPLTAFLHYPGARGLEIAKLVVDALAIRWY